MTLSLEVVTVIVVINVLATVSLWRATARKSSRPRKKFMRELKADPITPRHKPPTTIGDQFTFLASDEDRRFFHDFSDFAHVVNWWFADKHVGERWRLQELPDTELKIGFRDTPDFGRRYDVYHGQVCLGRLEVSPFLYSPEKPEVITSIELDMVRLLSFDDLAGFLSGIAQHVADNNPTSQEYAKAQQSIHGALTKALWQSQQISEFYIEGTEDWGELALQFWGSPSWYFVRRDCQAFREHRQAAGKL